MYSVFFLSNSARYTNAERNGFKTCSHTTCRDMFFLCFLGGVTAGQLVLAPHQNSSVWCKGCTEYHFCSPIPFRICMIRDVYFYMKVHKFLAIEVYIIRFFTRSYYLCALSIPVELVQRIEVISTNFHLATKLLYTSNRVYLASALYHTIYILASICIFQFK